METFDAVIVGAGPAGSTAALNLAPLHRVALVDKSAAPAPRIGESLPAAARRLFRDMGLLDSFLAEEHARCYAHRSAWGTAAVQELDATRDPDGPGWHLDRARFEAWLRAHARARGAELFAPATLQAIERHGDGWYLELACVGGVRTIRANVVIDAAGRTAPVARRAGARLHVHDRLVCGWLYGHDATARERGATFVESTRDGWWYTAPLPKDRRVLAFHTDADLPAARIAADPAALLRSAAVTGALHTLLSRAGFVATPTFGFTAAHSATLDPCAGRGFFAAGDAAVSFDPLSSQGLLNALFTGLSAAEAADAWLEGDEAAPARYATSVGDIAAVYRSHLAQWYAVEERWRDAPFWSRRGRD